MYSDDDGLMVFKAPTSTLWDELPSALKYAGVSQAARDSPCNRCDLLSIGPAGLGVPPRHLSKQTRDIINYHKLNAQEIS